ncbi:hypothetical protein PEC301619_31330 [Pectobacterium carotovorum subsp. carotovorum]|nr:hypothetical protein PEC301619_31330 [Pectobacterium carotovorum subsp. carotovorum]
MHWHKDMTINSTRIHASLVTGNYDGVVFLMMQRRRDKSRHDSPTALGNPCCGT